MDRQTIFTLLAMMLVLGAVSLSPVSAKAQGVFTEGTINAVHDDVEMPRPVSKRVFPLTRTTWARSGMISFTSLIKQIEDADVVFLGEFHDDPGSHQLELEMLMALFEARQGGVVLSLEMFERDVQAQLNAYLLGEITEEEFLESTRPWPNYDPDYRPLIEFAKAHGIPVIAANIPRPLASKVAKQGFEAAWEGYTAEEHRWVAADPVHPEDAYWARFNGLMGGNGHGMGMDPEMVKMFYAAQCIKDDTMAESIVRARKLHVGEVVLHVNGSFHSDYHLGTVSRVMTARPDDHVVVIGMRPAESFSRLDPAAEDMPEDMVNAHTGAALEDGRVPVADYVIFVPAPPPVEEEPMEMPMPPPATEGEDEGRAKPFEGG